MIGNNSSTGFVFEGGGLKGIYSAYYLQAIADKLVAPQILTGTSIGAFNAAFLAEGFYQGQSLPEASAQLCLIWQDLLKKFPLGVLSLKYLLSGRGLISPENIKDMLAKYIPTKRVIGDYATVGVQLFIAATDLTLATTHIFDEQTSVLEALSMSGAFTGVVASQKYAGHWYADGGVLEDTPLQTAINAEAKSIYVFMLEPLQQLPQDLPYQTALQVVGRAMSIQGHTLMANDLAFAQGINRALQYLDTLQTVADKQLFIQSLEEITTLVYGKPLQLANKKNIPIRILSPSAGLGEVFDFSKQAIQRRILLAQKDAQSFTA
jgi:NTE family protein